MSDPMHVPLAHLPTPLTYMPSISSEMNKKIWVMHDDMTGFALSGNKVRKLEYLAADALAHNATWLVTCGATQSNHARATAVAARQLRLGITIVARQSPQGPPPGAPSGNLMLDHLLGAEVVPLPYDLYERKGSAYEPFLDATAAELRQRGEIPYVIPEGGSTELGCFGYIKAAAELQQTWSGTGPGSAYPDNVFFADGSGGTHAGFRLGLDRLGLDPRIACGVNVTETAAHFDRIINDLMQRTAAQYGLGTPAGDLRIFDGYVGEGYAVATDDELRFYRSVAMKEGLILDPVYTGKAFRAMLNELQVHPDAFGDHIVFIHTGGMFGTFAFADQVARALD